MIRIGRKKKYLVSVNKSTKEVKIQECLSNRQCLDEDNCDEIYENSKKKECLDYIRQNFPDFRIYDSTVFPEISFTLKGV